MFIINVNLLVLNFLQLQGSKYSIMSIRETKFNQLIWVELIIFLLERLFNRFKSL